MADVLPNKAASIVARARQRIPRRYRELREHFVSGNRIELLRDGAEAFPAMLAAIEAASEQVLLEMYWFDSDRVGRRFAGALEAAMRRGVQVVVIYDALGSITADPSFFEGLRRAGATVAEFAPIAPWKQRFRLARLTRRDHRKILAVDGRVGFTGGINIDDAWSPEAASGSAFRDDMVRVEGPLVAELAGMVRRTLRLIEGDDALPLAAPSAPGDQRASVLGEGPNRHEIWSAYLARLYRAEQRAFITNAYFLPDAALLRALRRAADRGVDVRLLVPGESDVEIVQHASRATWARLMRHGVRIFQFMGAGILHSKTAVIDGRWATVGTFNLDNLSLRQNLEVNVAVLDEAFGERMERSFLADLESSYEVDPRVFRFRPLGERLLEFVLYPFRKFL